MVSHDPEYKKYQLHINATYQNNLEVIMSKKCVQVCDDSPYCCLFFVPPCRKKAWRLQNGA